MTSSENNRDFTSSFYIFRYLTSFPVMLNNSGDCEHPDLNAYAGRYLTAFGFRREGVSGQACTQVFIIKKIFTPSLECILK